jgi:hypothetical protein
MEEERRQHLRVSTRIPVTFRALSLWSLGSHSGGLREGTIHNLGAGGVQVSTDVLLPASTTVFVQFNLLGGPQADLAHGRVVATLPHGNRYLLSIAFTEISAKLLQAIEDFVITSTPNESQKLLL